METQNRFDALSAYIAANLTNVRQIEAWKDGRRVYGACFAGFLETDALHVMSVTKSVVSLLVGVAIDQGLIPGVQANVLSFFPEYEVKRGEKTIQSVTLEHLLTMTAPYKGKGDPWTRVCSSGDWTRAALDLLGGRAGLTGTFRYATLGIHILTGILARVSGLSTAEYANQFLFSPLGVAPVKPYVAATAEEHKAFILSKQPKERIWFADPMNVGAAGFGLCLSARDMARIGQLCLNGGVWDGKRIVSDAWIRDSVKMRVSGGEAFANMGYGYLWWTPDPAKPAYAALGNSGNVIYVDPEKRVVAAVSGVFEPRVYDRVRFIEEKVAPLLEES